MNKYLPEGELIETAENIEFTSSKEKMLLALMHDKIIEGKAIVCTGEHDLIVELPCGKGIIKRQEGALGIAEGTTKDIALLSKVGKPVCFKVLYCDDANGENIFYLSRRAAQQECMEMYINSLIPGDIIPARVTHLERFGCFVDIGCGIPSLIPIDAISVSRIAHPNDRFYNNQRINAVIKGKEDGKILLSHKELLGTWQENADKYSAGQTVGGIVRSVESYGIFVELAPNLAGLAESKEGVEPGQAASVFIKAILPDKMKVKLIIVDSFVNTVFPAKLYYFKESGHLSSWTYSTPSSNKLIETVF